MTFSDDGDDGDDGNEDDDKDNDASCFDGADDNSSGYEDI